MIVRIATEGQYEISEADIAGLNELDNEAVTACEASDEAGFRSIYERLLAFVRERGTAVTDDRLEPSELILPPPDVTLEEARAEFSGEGLIPG